MSTPIHPLTKQDTPRIDILYGGTELEVLQESVALSRDLMQHSLGEEEHVLYINTLISIKSFERHRRRAIRDIRQNSRYLSITLLQTQLASRLDFMQKAIIESNYRCVILNGFEFATLTSRHRIEIFFWLKALRDLQDVSLIIFTQTGPRKYGTLGQMRFVARTCEEVGTYKGKDSESNALTGFPREGVAEAMEEEAFIDERLDEEYLEEEDLDEAYGEEEFLEEANLDAAQAVELVEQKPEPLEQKPELAGQKPNEQMPELEQSEEPAPAADRNAIDWTMEAAKRSDTYLSTLHFADEDDEDEDEHGLYSHRGRGSETLKTKELEYENVAV
jgi:hypothetical protein